MATAPGSTPWRWSGGSSPPPALDPREPGSNVAALSSEAHAQVDLPAHIAAAVAMLALYEHRQLAVAAKADRYTELADQRIACHHRTVDIEGIAAQREAVAAGHIGVTRGVLPAEADGQLRREALAAAHVPTAAHAHGADIKRVLAAFQHQCRAAALLHRTIAVDPVLGELHIGLQLGPAVGPCPAAFHLGDGHIGILAAVQGLAQQRHFTRGARAVVTARHAASHREAVVPLSLCIQAERVATQAGPRAAIIQPRIQPFVAGRCTQHHMLAQLPVDTGHQRIAIGADLIAIAVAILPEHLAAAGQPGRSALAPHGRQFAAQALADALLQVVVIQQHRAAGRVHFTGELVERAARSAGVIHQHRVVQAQGRATLRQAVQRRGGVVLVARVGHGGERCGLRHVDLQVRRVRGIHRSDGQEGRRRGCRSELPTHATARIDHRVLLALLVAGARRNGIHPHGAAAHIRAAADLHRVAAGGAQVDAQRAARRQRQVAADGDRSGAIAGTAAIARAIARRQHATAGYGHATAGTADGAGAGERGATADGPLAADVAGDVQATAGDLTRAAEASTVAAQIQAARAGLHDAAATTDTAAERGGATGVDDQATVVGDVAGDRTAGPTVADLHGAAGIDGGTTGVGVVAGQGQRAAAGLGEASTAADGAAQRGVARHAGQQRAVVGDITDD